MCDQDRSVSDLSYFVGVKIKRSLNIYKFICKIRSIEKEEWRIK